MGGGPTAAASPGAVIAAPANCTSCKNAVSGTRTNAALQGGETFMQNDISTVYVGVCEGKYVYDYQNITSNKTIGMEVRTSSGESWTFTLKPGQKTSLKSSTQFTDGNYETYRISEVLN
jgi:hypothetical protein